MDRYFFRKRLVKKMAVNASRLTNLILCLLIASNSEFGWADEPVLDERGRVLLRQGDFEGLRSHLESVGQLHPVISGSLRLSSNDTSGATIDLVTASKMVEPSSLAKINQIVGMSARLSVEQRSMIFNPLRARVSDSLKWIIDLKLAELLVESSKFSEATILFLDAINRSESGETRKQSVFELAVAFYDQGGFKEALSVYDVLNDVEPETIVDPGHIMQRANFLVNAGNPEESLLLINEIRKNYPGYCEENKDLVLLGEARASKAVGDTSTAALKISELAKLGDDNPKFRVRGDLAKKIMEVERENQKILD